MNFHDATSCCDGSANLVGLRACSNGAFSGPKGLCTRLLGDGVGHFRGLTAKLDYLHWLGITCIWLLPFYQSPLRDGGYDISDYYAVLPEYGTIEDFKGFLDAAHAKGIRVIADLVINHTSDLHPWFQEARSAPDSAKRDWYVWSDSDQKYAQARIIFTDSERSNWQWDEQADTFYWHRFFSHQPRSLRSVKSLFINKLSNAGLGRSVYADPYKTKSTGFRVLAGNS